MGEVERWWRDEGRGGGHVCLNFLYVFVYIHTHYSQPYLVHTSLVPRSGNKAKSVCIVVNEKVAIYVAVPDRNRILFCCIF